VDLTSNQLSPQPNVHSRDICKELLFHKIKACEYKPAGMSLRPRYLVITYYSAFKKNACGNVDDYILVIEMMIFPLKINNV